jgi:transposase
MHALQAGDASQPAIAARFCVSLSFVEQLWQRFRRSGSSAAKPHAGGRRRALTDPTAPLRREGEHQPDATLEELRERLAAQGPRVSPATICRELQRPPAASKKKAPHAAERDTERVQTLRTVFRETVEHLDVRRLKSVDESGVNLAMTRRYGRATPGPRVVDSVPDNYRTN